MWAVHALRTSSLGSAAIVAVLVCLLSNSVWAQEDGPYRGLRVAADRTALPDHRSLAADGASVMSEGTRRVALVVGNAAYQSLEPLRNSRNDANDLCAALGRLGFTTTCLNDIVSRAEFRRALHQFASQLDTRSVALFFYAGHGVQVNGRNLLLPTAMSATTPGDLESGGLGMDEVFGALKDARAALNIVILDACRNDPFVGSRGPRVARGLAREDPPSGSVLVYATAPGSTASDGTGRNGLFTSHLLAEIERTGPQVGEMFRNVARQVENTARIQHGREQIPYRSFSFSGVFCFAACDETRIAEQVLALQQQRESALLRIRQLEAMNAALGSARVDAARTDWALQDSAERSNEIRSLRAQLDVLAGKSAQLEASRERIAALEREAREKEQRLSEGIRRDEQQRSRPLVVPTF